MRRSNSLRRCCQRYNILKFSEGGPNRKWLLSELKSAGIDASPDVSCYVGHTAICVYTANKEVLRKAERIIFGR